MFLFILQKWIQTSSICFGYRSKISGDIILITENSHATDMCGWGKETDCEGEDKPVCSLLVTAVGWEEAKRGPKVTEDDIVSAGVSAHSKLAASPFQLWAWWSWSGWNTSTGIPFASHNYRLLCCFLWEQDTLLCPVILWLGGKVGYALHSYSPSKNSSGRCTFPFLIPVSGHRPSLWRLGCLLIHGWPQQKEATPSGMVFILMFLALVCKGKLPSMSQLQLHALQGLKQQTSGTKAFEWSWLPLVIRHQKLLNKMLATRIYEACYDANNESWVLTGNKQNEGTASSKPPVSSIHFGSDCRRIYKNR